MLHHFFVQLHQSYHSNDSPTETIKNLHYKPLKRRSMNTVRVSCVRYCEYQLNYKKKKKKSRTKFCYVALHFFHCFSLNQNLKGQQK